MTTYRVAIIALLAAVTFYYAGNAGEATAITVVFNVIGSVLYYGYERLWDSISWGRRDKIAITFGQIEAKNVASSMFESDKTRSNR